MNTIENHILGNFFVLLTPQLVGFLIMLTYVAVKTNMSFRLSKAQFAIFVLILSFSMAISYHQNYYALILIEEDIIAADGYMSVISIQNGNHNYFSYLIFQGIFQLFELIIILVFGIRSIKTS